MGKLSVIIPTYNAGKTIKDCLEAVFSSTIKPSEVLVVDDCSTDNTIKIARKYPCRVIKLKKNSGPANARNIGVKKAKGDIIFFIDSDIILYKDTISKVLDFYKKHESVDCMIGMYSKESANKGFFREYMAYWKYYTWTNPKPRYFSFFIASIGTIKREVFLELGGFSTKYKGADVEDYEFGYRLTKDHKIYFNPKIQGKHYFPSFKSCLKNYFKRSSQWFEMFMKRKRFDTGAATPSRGFSSISTLATLLSLPLGLLSSRLLLIPLVLFVFFLASNIKFLYLLLKEKGLTFMLAGIITNFILGISISLGVITSIFRYMVR